MKKVLFILGIIISQFVYAQTDSIRLVKFTPGFRFKSGLYLSHFQLINNNPIPLKRIVSKYNKTGFDFFDKLLSEKKVAYYDEFGMRKEVKPEHLWGFCRRGSIYINWGDDFNRIPVVGSICHFIATITIYEERYSPNFGYGYYNMPTTTSHTEIYQYIMDFKTGKVLEYTVDNVLLSIMADTTLYDEFNVLRKKKKKQMKFLYLRKFNNKHTLYIPIN